MSTQYSCDHNHVEQEVQYREGGQQQDHVEGDNDDGDLWQLQEE